MIVSGCGHLKPVNLCWERLETPGLGISLDGNHPALFLIRKGYLVCISEAYLGLCGRLDDGDLLIILATDDDDGGSTLGSGLIRSDLDGKLILALRESKPLSLRDVGDIGPLLGAGDGDVL